MALRKKRTGTATIKGKTKRAKPASVRSVKTAKKDARRAARIERTKQRAAAKTARQGAKQAGKMDRLSSRLEKRKNQVDWRAQRKAAAQQLEDAATTQNSDQESVAMEVVASPQSVNKMKTYITSQEEEPISGNPAELATQAALLRQEEIEDTAEALSDIFEDEEAMDPDYADFYAAEYAENFCFDGENDTFDADNFVDPVTWAAIQKVGGKGIDLIIEKRERQGKKTFGKTGEEYRTAKAGTAPEKPSETAIGKMAEAGINKYKEEETKKTIKEMLPMIIIILVVIVSLTYYIAKRK